MKLSWNKFETCVDKLIKEINKSNYSPEIIVAVGVSGLIPAAIVAKKLNNNSIKLVIISSYKGRVRNIPEILSADLTEINNKTILCVDDIVATGETFKCLNTKLLQGQPKDIKFASPVVSARVCKNFPDFYGEAIDRSEKDFIEMPWD